MKNPEQVERIALLASVETAVRIAQAALDRAPMAYAVPLDHPIATAHSEASLALAKYAALVQNALTRLKR